MRRFLQAELWLYLRRHPGSLVREISAAGKGERRAISHVLGRMRAAGCARREGSTHRSKWYACGDKPECQWGLAAPSLRNLKCDRAQRIEWLRAAMLARGVDPGVLEREKPKRAQTYVDKHALAECWSRSPAQND